MAKSASHKAPLVALLTDFGLKDSYVGVVKGVIHGICPDVSIVDLCHNIAPQDVPEAAFVLAASRRYFPRGTIFVAVVDPSVGTERAILCMRADRQTFLAPDNGLLSVVAREGSRVQVRAVTAEQYFLKERSGTFDGRDIFAPVAAHLAAGLPPRKLGPVVRSIRELKLAEPVRTPGGRWRGEVIYVDHFGNLVTNIRRSIVAADPADAPENVRVCIKGRTLRGISQAYAQHRQGELLALIGSAGFLEVAVNQGSAARLLRCKKGERVTLTKARGGHRNQRA